MPIRLPRGMALAALVVGAAAAVPAPAAAQGDVVICADQAVPDGYAVVAVGRGQQCPGFYRGDFNLLTVRFPGDTVTACSAQTPGLPGYVATSRSRRQACPGFYSSEFNSALYRRLAPGVDAPPSPGEAFMTALEPYGRLVLQRLRSAEAQLGLDAPSHAPWTTNLRPGGTATVQLRLEAGISYTLVGVCDDDCTGLSLQLRGPSGATGESTPPGPQPVVRVAPLYAGVWTLQVSMRACRTSFCHVGVAAYETSRVTNAPPPSPSPRPSTPVRPTPRVRP